MYQKNCCKKCGSIDLFTKQNGNNTGLYCSDCGAWIKWLGKDELRAFENSKTEAKTDNIEMVSKWEAGNEILGRIQKLVPQEYYYNKNGVKIYGAAPTSAVTIGQITDIIINYVEGK